MLQPDAVRAAAEEVLSAALLGERWEEGLETLAHAAGAGGATLMRIRNDKPVAVMSSTAWAEADANLIAGRAPQSPRQFFPDQAFGRGFCLDGDLYTDAELSRDPYYQEFLRPRGVFWHAKVRLSAEPGERVTLSLKRHIQFGPYQRQDVAALDAIVPELMGAVRIGRRVLDAEATGMARVLHKRGDPVFELDAWGRVLRVHADDHGFRGIDVRMGRLASKVKSRQPAIERAAMISTRQPQRPASVLIADHDGHRTLLQFIPVRGRARDVFGVTAAIAVMIGLQPEAPRPRDSGIVSEVLGLTDREGQVAMLLAQGLSLSDIARQLHVQIGTVRNHLKNVFEKSGVRRQGELIALLSRLYSWN